jgi:hypothetical protein
MKLLRHLQKIEEIKNESLPYGGLDASPSSSFSDCDGDESNVLVVYTTGAGSTHNLYLHPKDFEVFHTFPYNPHDEDYEEFHVEPLTFHEKATQAFQKTLGRKKQTFSQRVKNVKKRYTHRKKRRNQLRFKPRQR